MHEQDGLTRFPLPRRGFLTGGLVTGFTMATTVVEAQAIHTDPAGLDAGETSIPTADGTLPAYYARPQGGGPFPVVLVVEEVFGVHEYIRDVCRLLARQGFLAVATEYYAREGALSDAMNYPQVMAIIGRAPDATIMTDMDATSAWAAAHHGDGTRLAVLGFCRGGRVTWLYAAHNARLRAAVAFYGPMMGQPTPIQPKGPLDVAGQIHCPLLGLYAGPKDPSTSAEQIAQAEATAKAHGKTVEIVVYPDAGHGFHADYRPSYVKADAEDAWGRALAWMRRYDGP
jgi:carboxymethylenebutenolidase